MSQEGCILGNVPIFFYADRGKPEYLAKYNKPFNTGSLQGLAIQINTDQELLSETQHGLSGAPDVSLSEGWLGSAVHKRTPPRAVYLHNLSCVFVQFFRVDCLSHRDPPPYGTFAVCFVKKIHFSSVTEGLQNFLQIESKNLASSLALLLNF